MKHVHPDLCPLEKALSDDSLTVAVCHLMRGHQRDQRRRQALQDTIRSWPNLRHRLMEGSYRPDPYTKTATRDNRSLEVPSIRDRVIMRCLHNALVINPAPSNVYLWYPERGRKAGIYHLSTLISSGRTHVFVGDIKHAFQSVSHHAIRQALWWNHPSIPQCHKLWKVIKRFLSPGDNGIPLGSGLGPVLMNLVLYALDIFMPDVVRAADDFVITETTKENLVVTIHQYQDLILKLGLEINQDKIQTQDMTTPGSSIRFLGYTITVKDGKVTTNLNQDLIPPQRLPQINSHTRQTTTPGYDDMEVDTQIEEEDLHRACRG